MIDAELGGYARIRRPIFRIGGVPVLWAPAIIVPLKSSRQSGVLVPNAEQSKMGGLALSIPYFWAINRSQDFTFTPKYYTERGLKLMGDYRYVVNETSKGELRTAWIDDDVFLSADDIAKKNLNKFDRYFVWYSQHLDMPENFTVRAEIKQVSDLRYPRDFPQEIQGHGDPALENKVSITKSADNQIASAEVDLYTNMLHTDPLQNNEDAVHRAPELRYNIKDQNLFDSGLFFSLNSQYVNFTREDKSYDDLWSKKVGAGYLRGPINDRKLLAPRDGQFSPFFGEQVPLDLMRTGQRFDINPKLAYPFRIGRLLDVVPAIEYRETQYRFYPSDSAEAAGFGPTAARRYLQTDLTAKTEFTRVFGGLDPKADRFKHSFEPEVGYSYIPFLRRPDHPFFGDFKGLQYTRQFEPVSDADLSKRSTGIQFDYLDRTYEKQLVNFALNNRFTRKTWKNGEPEYKTVGLVRLSQSYDINEANSSRTPRPWSSVNLLADMRLDHFETYTTAEYNGYAKVTNISSRVRLKMTEKNFLQAGYTRNFIFDDDYIPTNETRNFAWGAGLALKYVDIVGQFEYEARDTRLQAFRYMMNLRPPGKCWVLKLEQRLVLLGEQTTRVSFNFDFGGENKDGLL